MARPSKHVPEIQPPGSRFVSAAFGLLFVAVAVVVFFLAPVAPYPVGATIAGVVIGALGLEALVAALRNRRSLASRIGPLP